MYRRTFFNTFGNVLKIVTNKNGAGFPCKMLITSLPAHSQRRGDNFEQTKYFYRTFS